MCENNDKIRLVKFIAASGAASRRKAGDLVKVKIVRATPMTLYGEVVE